MSSSPSCEQQQQQQQLPPSLDTLPDEAHKRKHPFSIYDVFFWRDVPDWYKKTFVSAGFGLCYCTMRQYLSRHELEVFMPPRAKVLPDAMRDGYRATQRFKYGLFKVGKETTVIAGTAGAYYAGSYYFGRYRGVHDWKNFAAGGGAAGAGLAVFMIRPPLLRTTLFGSALGAALGSAGAWMVETAGLPLWDETHGFEGWWLGSYISQKGEDQREGV